MLETKKKTKETMLNPRRIESDTCPPKFINLRDGTWYYNYDIKSRVAEVPIGEVMTW